MYSLINIWIKKSIIETYKLFINRSYNHLTIYVIY